MTPRLPLALPLAFALALAVGTTPLEPRAQGLEELTLQQQVKLAAWMRGPAITPAEVAAAYLDETLPEAVSEKIVNDALDGYAELLASGGACKPIPAGQAYEEIRRLMPQQMEGFLADDSGPRLRALLVLRNGLAEALCFGSSL